MLPYPAVGERLPEPHAPARVALEEPADEVAGLRRDMRREADDAVQDAVVELVLLGVGRIRGGGRVFGVEFVGAAVGAGGGRGAEGRVPDEEFVGQHADGPAVHRLCCCDLVHFVRSVVRSFVRWFRK